MSLGKRVQSQTLCSFVRFGLGPLYPYLTGIKPLLSRNLKEKEFVLKYYIYLLKEWLIFGCCTASAFEKYNVSHLNFVHSVLFFLVSFMSAIRY